MITRQIAISAAVLFLTAEPAQAQWFWQTREVQFSECTKNYVNAATSEIAARALAAACKALYSDTEQNYVLPEPDLRPFVVPPESEEDRAARMKEGSLRFEVQKRWSKCVIENVTSVRTDTAARLAVADCNKRRNMSG